MATPSTHADLPPGASDTGRLGAVCLSPAPPHPVLLPPSLAAARAAGLLPGSRRPASGPRCLGRNVFPSDTEEGVSANPAGPSRLLWDQSPASWLGRGPRACPWPGPPTSSRPPASSSSSVVSVADDENTLFSPKKSNKNQPTPKKVNVVEKAACRGPLQVRDRGAALLGPPHVGLCGPRSVASIECS